MGLSSEYRVIPGKSGENHAYLPLWMHLEDTAFTMEYLCDNRVSESVRTACGLDKVAFRKIATFLAMIHDVGKCTPLFVSKLLHNLPDLYDRLASNGITLPAQFLYADKSPHAFAGEVLLTKRGFPSGICSVVGAHHGKPTSDVDYSSLSQQLVIYKKNYFAEQETVWTTIQDEITQRAMQRAEYSSKNDLPELSCCAQMILAGLLVQADWIASNDTYFPLLSGGEDGHESDYPSRAETAFKRLNMPSCWHSSLCSEDTDLYFQTRFGFKPNCLQSSVTDAARSMTAGGLMIIEAQMGIGKTEAALSAAEILSAKAGCGGIFFGLPTQATTNGIFPRLAGWAEKLSDDQVHSIRLVHGMAELNEDYQQYFHGQAHTDDDGQSGLIAHGWFTGRKQALLADFVAGTVDTALLSVLKQKHIMLRHLGLCGKTIIIDECHAYDAYMSKYLDQMLYWFGAYRIPVVLLSATLPEQRRLKMLKAYLHLKSLPEEKADGYPLITWTDNSKINYCALSDHFSSHQVNICKLNECSLVSDLKNRLVAGGCVGVIVNTVKRAQAIFNLLKASFPDKKVYVYHAQFLAEDRVRRENELMAMIGKHSTSETRNDVIVVGTQVLEQSLDIDFDYLVTDLCPMDLLLQRIGRLHRHNRPRPQGLEIPCCSVMNTEGELEKGAEIVYHRWPLIQTKKYLPEVISIPKDIPHLVNLVYAEQDSDYNDADWQEFRNMTEIKEVEASQFLLGKPKQSRFPAMNSITGMLDISVESDRKAEASVRDGSPSVDVLLMIKQENGKISFMPWVSDAELSADTVPSPDEGKLIAKQRIKLPSVFCIGKRLNETVEALEAENDCILPNWQKSPWLKGELIFLLNPDGERDFAGYHVKYEQEFGFTYERGEKI